MSYRDPDEFDEQDMDRMEARWIAEQLYLEEQAEQADLDRRMDEAADELRPARITQEDPGARGDAASLSNQEQPRKPAA